MSTLDLVTPFWRSGRMIGETVLFVRAKSDQTRGSLAFVPAHVRSVCCCDGRMTFEVGRDYVWEPATRVIRIPEGSRIPVADEARLYPPRGSQKYGTCRTRDADIFFTEGADYLAMQVAVTYDFNVEQWDVPHTLVQPQCLPRLSQKLNAQRTISVVILGDSISVGMNASALYHVPPHQPGYGELFVQAMRETLNFEVISSNLSVSGKSSAWGIGQISAAAEAKPDLVLLAFGMNDASGKISAAQFAERIQQIMFGIRNTCPNAEFILVAPMTGNPEWTGTEMDYYPCYRDALWRMRDTGIAVADVTSVWTELLKYKNFLDLTGNGLNHPNDFGHRVYAQVLWSLFQLCSTATVA